MYILSVLSESATGGTRYTAIIIWIVILVVFMFVFMIRPQRKERQKKEDMMSKMDVGDTVCTTSGFYGTLIDVEDDVVIVEFGNNRNCRIPMQRSAIAQIEKAEDAIEE
ncbi:MAG: preprotein translocase subunit YajC [Lachnospiraceae bacterium]|nr:preprotein translocase subunit YajC [Lachnospiraceae bacterium]